MLTIFRNDNKGPKDMMGITEGKSDGCRNVYQGSNLRETYKELTLGLTILESNILLLY